MTADLREVRRAPVDDDAVVDQVVRAMLDGDTDAYLAVCAADVLLDLVVPFWRFQVVGLDAVRATLAEEFLPGRKVGERHVTRTADGVLIELAASAAPDGVPCSWWDIHHVRIADGLVVEHICYCSGLLDAEQLSRQQVEAPWVRQR